MQFFIIDTTTGLNYCTYSEDVQKLSCCLRSRCSDPASCHPEGTTRSRLNWRTNPCDQYKYWATLVHKQREFTEPTGRRVVLGRHLQVCSQTLIWN